MAGPRRAYRLGRRHLEIERTEAAIVAAGRDLVAAGALRSVGAVAARAGVSRLTVYNRFGSKAGLLDAIAEAARRGPARGPLPVPSEPRQQLRQRIAAACSMWASDPSLFRRLPAAASVGSPDENRGLAEHLAAADQLRPGCSLKEAEDVIDVVTAFPTFDRLHNNGRRSTVAVAEILLRLAGGILKNQDT